MVNEMIPFFVESTRGEGWSASSSSTTSFTFTSLFPLPFLLVNRGVDAVDENDGDEEEEETSDSLDIAVLGWMKENGEGAELVEQVEGKCEWPDRDKSATDAM